jgi:Fe2+ or Zn2+ uptake regulation protein
MSTPNRREVLQSLYEQLEHLQPKDAETAASLEQIRAQVREALAQADHADIDHESLLDRLNESAFKLDVDHPGVGATIQSVINTLTNLGL